ncbi:MAG: hypothetical protein CSA70_08040 [Rhodobacterales bacterium]|nr:MAG: hypothetical protein CSA70_08040 [Rhodobacterales bacterium]
MIWILLSIAAAAFQTLRFMIQKSLSMTTLSPGGATLARFLFSAPFVAALLVAYLAIRGAGFPSVGERFWIYGVTGGIAQILATWCVVALFAQRSFAVGITFKKTEVMQTALVGFILLGDTVSSMGIAAIFLGLVGVLYLSNPTRKQGLFLNRAVALGIVSGALFAVSAVAYRGATLEVQSGDALLRALLALAVVTWFQTVGLSAWLVWRAPGELGNVLRSYRSSVWMGLTGMAGSICWFTAFTLQNAAYVFAVGQVEVIFSIMASVMFFSERMSHREMTGIALVTSSILLLVVVT